MRATNIHHQPPISTYNGLTILLDNPSRFDKERLLTGYVGQLFDNNLRPLIRSQCDIRTLSSRGDLLHNTRVLLACGDRVLEFLGCNNPLTNQRGSPLSVGQIVAIPTYYPQDVCDIKDYEGQFNATDTDGEGTLSMGKKRDAKDSEDSTGKGHGASRRKNWKFWFLQDLKKAVAITQDEPRRQAILAGPQEQYEIYPPSEVVIQALSSISGSSLYLDIETDSDYNITCFGFAGEAGPTYCVPCYRYNYTEAYSNLPHIFRALAVALRSNTVVCHNSLFDLFILAWKYHIPVGRAIYDTMLAHHRCYPEVEKSLGHCVSLWTDMPYHKGEGIFQPRNQEQENQLWAYNAKDVASMRRVRVAIDKHAATDRGLAASIAQVNSSIRPYLIATLTGMAFDEKALQERLIKNDRRLTQYLRLLKIATGREINPNSPKQVAEYLYARPPQGLGLRQPPKNKTNEETLRKILVKESLAPLNIILAFRGLAKESSTLKFEPWPPIL